MPSAFNALAMIHPVVRYRGYSWIRDSCRDGEEEKKEVQTGRSELSLEEGAMPVWGGTRAPKEEITLEGKTTPALTALCITWVEALMKKKDASYA